ncbi:MAG: YbhB/YbcL family Raf kinase inhibitor-like protein [Candidatus Dactylopiibacterium sp.]|nr:YbhB/YbcL family Raf kinase inhibitor-like protein [Candidatus Dactylopiibacterium sp.]
MKIRHTLIALALAGAGLSAQAAGFSLASSDIQAGATVGADMYWNSFGCSGKNVMPALSWKDAPAGTRSFAVTFYDKDAPTGSGFWHWVLYDIPAGTTRLAGGAHGGALPAGAVEGNTDLGKPGFMGPCPPVGRQHRYVYTVHALKVDKLPVDAGASPALVGFFLWQNRLAEATLDIKAGPRK